MEKSDINLQIIIKLIVLFPILTIISLCLFLFFGISNVKAYQVLPTGVYFNGISHGYDADRLYTPNSDTTFVNFDLGEHGGNFKIDVAATYRVDVAHLYDNSVNLSSFSGVVHFGTEVVNMSKSCNILDKDLYFGTVNCSYSLTYFNDTNSYVIIQLQNSPNVFGTDIGGEKSSIKVSVRVFVKPLSEFDIADNISGGNQDIINNNNGNTQEIINNQDKNSQDIINNQDKNKDEIINNQDKNTQDVINNQDKLNKDTYYDCNMVAGNLISSYEIKRYSGMSILKLYNELLTTNRRKYYLHLNHEWLNYYKTNATHTKYPGFAIYFYNNDVNDGSTACGINFSNNKLTYNLSCQDTTSFKTWYVGFALYDKNFDWTDNGKYDLSKMFMITEDSTYPTDFVPIGTKDKEVCTNKIDKTNEQLEEQNKTSKGILETLINLPKTLIDLFTNMLKSLFIPTEDDLNDIINKSTELSENFGFVGESFSFVIRLFTSIAGIVNGDGCLILPKLHFQFNGILNMEDYVMWEQQNVCMVDNPWFGKDTEAIDIVRTITTGTLVCAFISFAVSQLNKILSKEDTDI